MNRSRLAQQLLIVGQRPLRHHDGPRRRKFPLQRRKPGDQVIDRSGREFEQQETCLVAGERLPAFGETPCLVNTGARLTQLAAEGHRPLAAPLTDDQATLRRVVI